MVRTERRRLDLVGTITIDGAEFGMAFFNTGTGKPFDNNPSDVAFFEEMWTIYDELEFTFDEFGVLATFEPGNIVLSGYDRGIVTPSNSKYDMNGRRGTVLQVARPARAHERPHRVVPVRRTAVRAGTFRIN